VSVFKRVVEAHAKAKTAAEHAAAAAAAARNAAEIRFATDFRSQVQSVAKPIFQEFVADAIAHGFPATIEDGEDGKGNPLHSLRLIPEVGAVFNSNRSNECVYAIKGLVTEQKVEHASYFDQRPGKNGIKKGTFGIQSINPSVLERELGEFLSSALKARAGERAP